MVVAQPRWSYLLRSSRRVQNSTAELNEVVKYKHIGGYEQPAACPNYAPISLSLFAYLSSVFPSIHLPGCLSPLEALPSVRRIRSKLPFSLWSKEHSNATRENSAVNPTGKFPGAMSARCNNRSWEIRGIRLPPFYPLKNERYSLIAYEISIDRRQADGDSTATMSLN